MNEQDNLLTSKEAAEYLHIKEATLRNWRCSKKYKIKFIRVGKKKIMYEKKELEEFLYGKKGEN